RRQRAKLVVVLEEPVEPDAPQGKTTKSQIDITKTYDITGDLKDAGLIENEGQKRVVTLPRVTVALAGLLALVLVLGSLAQPNAADPTISCSSGDLRIEGSSVFLPVMKQIADEYAGKCHNQPNITIKPNGSIAGVRSVAESEATAAPGLIALSDG